MEADTFSSIGEEPWRSLNAVVNRRPRSARTIFPPCSRFLPCHSRNTQRSALEDNGKKAESQSADSCGDSHPSPDLQSLHLTATADQPILGSIRGQHVKQFSPLSIHHPYRPSTVSERRVNMAKPKVTAYLLFLTFTICLGSMQFGYHLVSPLSHLLRPLFVPDYLLLGRDEYAGIRHVLSNRKESTI